MRIAQVEIANFRGFQNFRLNSMAGQFS